MGEFMTVPVAEIKLGIDTLKMLFKSFKKIATNKKEKTLISDVYKELLLGDKSDFSKIESKLIQLEKIGADSPDFLKARNYFAQAEPSKGATHRHVGFGTYSAVKKKAVRKSAGKVTRAAKKRAVRVAKPIDSFKCGTALRNKI
jgi:hypothetical protein